MDEIEETEIVDAVVESTEMQPEFVEERPENCVCSDYSFETYGCMCRKRIQPGI